MPDPNKSHIPDEWRYPFGVREPSITPAPMSTEDFKKVLDEISNKAYRELLKQLPLFPKETPDETHDDSL